jgi:hypothetical protein
MTRLPDGIDPNRPSAARIYDYFLGGTHNFAADRAVAARAIELVPEIPAIAKENRAFLRRAVRFATAEGIEQFLDIGSGIPTEGNVHEVARATRPDARVVYADVEPTAVIHARAILGDDPNTVAVQADLHDADALLEHPDLRRLFDLDKPVCLLMIAMLHFVPDTTRLRAALRRYHAALPSGSLVVVSHGTESSTRKGEQSTLAELYTRSGTPLVLRDRDQLADLLGGWDLVDPGITIVSQWRPDPGSAPVGGSAFDIVLAAVARKR